MGTLVREAAVSGAHRLCLESEVDLNHSAFVSLEEASRKH